MSDTHRCPNCRAIRPVGADYCPQCGTPFDMARSPMQEPRPPSDPFDVSLRTAIKIGSGFAIGVALVGVVVWCVAIILFALSLGLVGR